MRVKIPQRLKLALPVTFGQPSVRFSSPNSSGSFGSCRKYQIFLWRCQVQEHYGTLQVARLLHQIQGCTLLRIPILSICPAALQDHQKL